MFINGMDIGASVDAIIGELFPSAFDPDSVEHNEKIPADAGDSFSFQSIEDFKSLESIRSFSATGSVTFPVNGLDVSVKNGFDFSSSKESQGSTIIYLLNWEHTGELLQLDDGAKLQDAVAGLNAKDFRSHHGDYFVYQIARRAKFSAIWYVTQRLGLSHF